MAKRSIAQKFSGAFFNRRQAERHATLLANGRGAKEETPGKRRDLRRFLKAPVQLVRKTRGGIAKSVITAKMASAILRNLAKCVGQNILQTRFARIYWPPHRARFCPTAKAVQTKSRY